MDLQKFYFTYGAEGSPYYGGWTEVWASNAHLACQAFRAFHPDKTPGLLNCSCVYTAEDFEKTCMAGPTGNFGYHCHETITLNLTVTVSGVEVK